MKDITKVKWKEKDGSIFTEQKYEVTFISGKKMINFSVAFNVGESVAKRIVKLHNESLTKE